MPASGYYQAKGSPDVYKATGNGVLQYVPNASEFGGDYSKVQQVDSLNSIYAPDIQAQADAQVDPAVALAQQQAGSDTTAAQTANQRLQDSIAKVFAQKRENDPLAKMGVYSGAADVYNTGQNVDQVTQANQDLTTQLSDIANRLKTTQSNAVTQKQGIISNLTNTYGANNQAAQDKVLADKLAANKLTTVDLGGSVALMKPDGTIVQTIRKTATPTSGSSLASTPGNLESVVKTAISSGQYTATGEPGKQSREQLINQLNSYYQGKIPLDSIKSAVYGTLTSPGEAPYNPTTSSANNAKASQTQTNVATAQQALSDLKAASQAINTAPNRGSLAYWKQIGSAGVGTIQGNSGPVAQLNLQGEAILTAIRALTNTGRITTSEINALKLPTYTDTATEAQTKITALERLLNKAAGGTNSPSGSQQGPTAPTSGKLSSGMSYTVTP